MKKLFIVFISCCLLGHGGAALAQDAGTQDYQGQIFPAQKDYQPMFRQMFPEFTGRFTPTVEEARRADALSRAYLQSYDGPSAYYKNNIPRILESLDGYGRQYFGFVDQEGNRVIWINYFLNDPEEKFDGWRDDIMLVLDGGYRYFNVKVNLTTGECYGLRINGVA